MLSIVIVSTQTTTLSALWMAVAFCAAAFLLAVVLGVLFRSRWAWRAAVFLVCLDLLLAIAAAVTDRFGYGPQ